MDRIKKADELHGKGYNCAQAVACAYCDLFNADEKEVFRMMEGYGLGMGDMKCTCGAVNTGKFCAECGSPKPADEGWTCACGAVNKGKFCPECGAKKPAGVPVYKCDKCGWEPEKGTTPPKFCPECGDRFDESDAN